MFRSTTKFQNTLGAKKDFYLACLNWF